MALMGWFKGPLLKSKYYTNLTFKCFIQYLPINARNICLCVQETASKVMYSVYARLIFFFCFVLGAPPHPPVQASIDEAVVRDVHCEDHMGGAHHRS